MRRYSPLLLALLGAFVLAVKTGLVDGDWSLVDSYKVGAAVVGAFLVWLTANGPVGTAWSQAKAIAYGVSAVLAGLVLISADGTPTPTASEWVDLIILFLAGAGVLAVSDNAPAYRAVAR